MPVPSKSAPLGGGMESFYELIRVTSASLGKAFLAGSPYCVSGLDWGRTENLEALSCTETAREGKIGRTVRRKSAAASGDVTPDIKFILKDRF